LITQLFMINFILKQFISTANFSIYKLYNIENNMKAHFPVFNFVNNIGGINFEELSVNISEYFLAIEGDSDNKRGN